ncbi:MAG: TonB-dependent receptor plug domain-containing protein [Alistipes onderdonkii]
MPLDVDKNDEIIDMGWTKQRRGDISGAVSSIKGKSLESAPVATLSMALAGQISGLSVIEQSYSPDNAWARVLLRGASNPKNENESPAVVIDGVPYFYGYWSNPFEYITAREIESITVLKDASTEALYGVKGGNGVIVITTKRGQKGKVNIDVAYDQSVQQPIKTPKVFHSWAALRSRTKPLTTTTPAAVRHSLFALSVAQYASGENRDLYPDNNWYDMFYRDWLRWNVRTSTSPAVPTNSSITPT